MIAHPSYDQVQTSSSNLLNLMIDFGKKIKKQTINLLENEQLNNDRNIALLVVIKTIAQEVPYMIRLKSTYVNIHNSI